MTEQRNIVELIDEIIKLVPIEKIQFHHDLNSCKQSVEFSPPELMQVRFRTLQKILFDNMPKDNEVPSEEWQYDVMSLISNTPKEEIKAFYKIDTKKIESIADKIFNAVDNTDVLNKLYSYARTLEDQLEILSKATNNGIQEPISDMLHIDDFIDYRYGKDCYARWIFNHFRLPAVLKIDFEQFMKEHKLFCLYEGEQYRCTGASRMGDVWLTKNFNKETGYDIRVDVAKCSEWAPNPK